MYAPENTIEAFSLAVEQNSDAIELDVHMSSDNEIVVSHDGTLERCSNGTGEIKDYSVKTLKQFNFGKNMPKYGVCQIPTLREVYELIKPTGLFINVEIKGGFGMIEPALAELAIEMDMVSRVIYSSFNHDSLKNMKKYEVNCKTGILYGDFIENVWDYCKNNGFDAIHCHFGLLKDNDTVSKCHENGILVHPWTVDNVEDLMYLYKIGVDAVITDVPDVARNVLNEILK